jgi:hypothetical protein
LTPLPVAEAKTIRHGGPQGIRLASSPWWNRVIADRIAFPNTALPVIHKQLSPLIAAGLDGFPLCWVNPRWALATGTTNWPTILMRDHMLIVFAHD